MQGYVDKARSRPEMFPANRIDVVFSNIGDIFRFSTHLLADLESALDAEQPHASQIGHVFLKHVRQTHLKLSVWCFASEVDVACLDSAMDSRSTRAIATTTLQPLRS